MKAIWRNATPDDKVRFRIDEYGYVRAISYVEHGSKRCVGPLGATDHAVSTVETIANKKSSSRSQRLATNAR